MAPSSLRLKALFILALLSVIILNACGVPSPSRLFIAEKTIVMDEGEHRTLNFTTSFLLDDLSWTSSNQDVVSVVDGRITALKEGTATIQVTADTGRFFDTVLIRVIAPISVPPHPPENEDSTEPRKSLEIENPVVPEVEVPVVEEPDVPVEPKPEIPVVGEPKKEVTNPPSIFTVTIKNEAGDLIQTLSLEEGSLISEGAIELPENFKGFFLDGQTCNDEPFNLETPITEDLTLIKASFNQEAPCIQLDYIVLNGRPVAGTTLSVDVFPLGANVSISWYTSVNNRTYREISGETGSTFTVRPEDSGKFIRVYVVSDSNPPVVRYDTIKLDVFGTLSNGGPTQLISDASITALLNQGYIPISSLEDMEAINSTSSHVFASNTNLALTTEGGLNKNYVVINDIDLSAYTGTTSVVNGTFTGTFEGNGYTVSDLTINATNIDNMGLFSQISGASIQNLTLQAFNITGNEFVGALAAKVNGTGNVISNIQLLQSQVGGRDFVGGLIGRVEDADITMTDVTNTGDVSGSNNHIGGMIGDVRTNVTLTMTDVTNTGDVSGSNRVGGMIGYVLSNVTLTMTNVNNTGDVSGSNRVGGMIGWVYSNVTLSMTDVTNTGDVSGSNRVGGVIGNLQDNVITLTMVGITNTGDVSGSNEVGGIIGDVRTNVTLTMTMTEIINNGTVSGSNDVGGVIGKLHNNNGSTNITGSNIFVTGPGITTGAAASTTGQIIGQIATGDITVNLTGIHVNRPSNHLYLVGADNNSHTFSGDNKDTFVNKSITKSN